MSKSKLLKNIKIKEHMVKEKQMVVVYFDFQYPMNPEDIQQVTQTISNIVNEDRRFINRCIFLPKGFDMYNLSEEDFITIWKSKVDSKEVDEILKEDESKDPNQLEIFETDVEVIDNE